MPPQRKRKAELPTVSTEQKTARKELELVQTNEKPPVSSSLGGGLVGESLPECCGTCQHYQALNLLHGFCRRYPPTTVLPSLQLTNDGPLGIFPITLSSNLCGEFQQSS